MTIPRRQSRVSATHTTGAIAATLISSVPMMLAGEADGTKLVGPYTHPLVEIGTGDGNQQFAVLELYELRQNFAGQQGEKYARRVAGPMRIESGSAGAAGFALEPSRHGHQVRAVQYMVKIQEATGTGKLGFVIQRSANGEVWATQKSYSTAAVGSTPVLLVADCDLTKSVGEFFRPVITTESAGGDSFVVEVFELVKSYY